MYTTFFNLILVTIHITPYLILKRFLLRQIPPPVFPPFNLHPFFYCSLGMLHTASSRDETETSFRIR